MLARKQEFDYTREDFDRLRALAEQHVGIVAPDDKARWFYRRLIGRVRSLRLPDFCAYCDLLESSRPGDEFNEFINSVTTNVTSFFRESYQFDALEKDLLPRIMERNAATRQLSVWSAGCSTGEEVYSLAMAIRDKIPDSAGWRINVLGTDIDSHVLAKAARGRFSTEQLSVLDDTLVQRWFQRGTGHQQEYWFLDQTIQSMVSFRQVNLMRPWSLRGPFDIIFCRNVMIYFDKQSRADILERFEQVMAPGAFLVLGSAESLYGITNRYEPLGKAIFTLNP